MDHIDSWLILHHTPTIGAVTFRKLIEHFGSAEEVLLQRPAALRQCGLLKQSAIDHLSREQSVLTSTIQQDLQWLEQEHATVITLNDALYPPLLREISDPPPLLYVHGDPELLSFPQLAMVGSRNPDLQGKEIARQFARQLARMGLAVTSGMAMGIDTEAHIGALDTGKSVAVIGTGPDRVYPARNRKLAHQLVEQGAVISEFAVGTEARPENFPRRNRIISGLALGTLVVQATLKSGSLITARLAMEQGREVFAIPGSIHNPQVRGNHQLIRQGAKLVETTADIVDELEGMIQFVREQITTDENTENQSVNDEPKDSTSAKLLHSMGYEPILIDQLIEYCGLTTETVSSIIMQLEIQGEVVSLPGGKVQRRVRD